MSESYTAQGIIHSIGQTMELGSNGFTKREFVIKLTGEGENDEYPNHIALNVTKDKCAMLDQYVIGQEVKVAFNLGGRLWAGNGNGEKCFVDLGVWKMAAVGQAQQPQQQPQQQAPAYQQVQQPAPVQQAPQQVQQMAQQPQPVDFDDDIPF